MNLEALVDGDPGDEDAPQGQGDLCFVCREDLVVEGEDMCAFCLGEVFAVMDEFEDVA